MDNHKDNSDITELFSDLEKNLGELSCFVSAPISEMVLEQFENLPDLISKARGELATVEKRIKELGSIKANSKSNNNFTELLSRHKSSFRKLALDSKKKSDQFRQEKLLESTSLDSKANRRKSKQNTAARAAASITEGLKRTGALLESEIKKSASSYQVFSESSKMLQETRQAYGLINDVMQHSKTLLSELEWSEIVDYIVLCIGFFIFSSTVAYVISKRTHFPIPSPLSFLYLLFYIIQKIVYIMTFFWRTLFAFTPRPQEAPLASAPTYVSAAAKYGICPARSFSTRFALPTCGLTPS
ncbi:hypothetical protein DSO57_1024562 [Entomophthora muscae]|uniref:Uncharacterized protein n=1 Tax=Entomophthora muscae TaxID=34485 RepID=A0ACC2RH94_9FUNG|nr:hypothetical protein DSO57_1024562 [Entomophthora muscae]